MDERGRHQQRPSEYLRERLPLDVGAPKHIRFGIECGIVAAVETPVTEFVRRGVPLNWRRTFGGDQDAARTLWQVCPQEPSEREESEPQTEALDQAEHIHLARLVHARLDQAGSLSLQP